MLKKDGSFPLEAPGTIAAFGSGVRHIVKGGTGSGEVNSRYFVTVEKGLKKAGFTIVNGGWLDAYDRIREDNKAAFYKAIKAKARKEKKNVIAASMGAVILEPEYDLPLTFGAASGHTLFMTGSRKDYEELVQGIKDGIVSREQLKWNAHWLLETLKITRSQGDKANWF